MRSAIYKRVYSIFLIIQLISSVLPTIAQTRRASVAKNDTPAAKAAKTPACQGGWSGVVTLRKRLNESLESDEPGIRKSIDRIIHKTSRKYDYTGTTIVNSKDPQNPRVTSKVAFSDVDKDYGQEKVFDSCHAYEPGGGHWFVIEGIDNRTTEAKASGPARSFNLTVNEANGTYSFSLELPDAVGTFNREEHTKRTGHCQEKNNQPFDRSTNEKTKIEGESVSVRDKLEPDHPDEISGTKSWGDDGKGHVRTFVYTATWRFTRCPQKLLITDVRFEHMKFPAWDNWVDITDEVGTIDGNLVKVKANVVNLSDEAKFAEITFKETYKGDKWDGARPDYPLHDSVSIRLEPGEEREVEVLWNTQGFAWFDDGRPRYLQRVKVEAWEEFKKKDEMTKNLKISPKPLVIVPGIWTDPKVVELYQNLLTVTHSYGWKAYRMIDISKQGTVNQEGAPVPIKKNRSVFEYGDNLAKYVENVQRENNAWHVDMVAHSTGGLIARLFVHKQEVWPDNYPVVKHLLLLGVPNLGTPCADSLTSFDRFKDYEKTAEELKPEEIARFNRFVTERKGTRFSALVGNGSSTLCAHIETGDGFVGVESARFGLEDFAITSDSHPDLLEPRNFGKFIKPHLVTGPRGTYPLPVESEAGGKDGRRSDQE